MDPKFGELWIYILIYSVVFTFGTGMFFNHVLYRGEKNHLHTINL